MHFENFLLISHFSGVSENLSLSFNFTLFLYDFSPGLFDFPLIHNAYSPSFKTPQFSAIIHSGEFYMKRFSVSVLILKS